MLQRNTECFPKSGYTTQSTRRWRVDLLKRKEFLFCLQCSGRMYIVMSRTPVSRTEHGVRKHFQKIPAFKGLQLCTVCIQQRNSTETRSEVFLISYLMGTCPSHACQVVLFPHSSRSWRHRGWQDGYYAILWRQPFPECKTQVWNRTVNFETSLCTMLSFKGFLKGIILTSSTVSSSSAS